jgi:hypothetical protein
MIARLTRRESGAYPALKWSLVVSTGPGRKLPRPNANGLVRRNPVSLSGNGGTPHRYSKRRPDRDKEARESSECRARVICTGCPRTSHHSRARASRRYLCPVPRQNSIRGENGAILIGKSLKTSNSAESRCRNFEGSLGVGTRACTRMVSTHIKDARNCRSVSGSSVVTMM